MCAITFKLRNEKSNARALKIKGLWRYPIVTKSFGPILRAS
jgi:hypothetical protein